MLRVQGMMHAWRTVRPGMRHYSSVPPKSKHALLYREIFPSLIKVLAYSTATYFALHLTWELLDAREQRIKQEQEISALKSDILDRVNAKQI
ncbi:hypothetical protein MCUN1_002009 [Malassezia cuniculi]|uniref:Uncharacterized protein n=1 Tax=Malassezia cuniculi TaxID=948313 RepID=A0AAF0J707_9BASI|nr:hypothetical protein MCUN1_002009 [Malassezia cuniculi]